MSWCTIESDPAVFTELIDRFGVEDVAVEEIVSLEEEYSGADDEVSAITENPTHGLVFLFKYTKETYGKAPSVDLNENPIPDLYFAKQVIADACATLGACLGNLKGFLMSIDPESRGYTIGQTDDIRIAHNSFSRPETFGATDKPLRGAKSEDVYHFISYVPCNGVVYELDGLRDGPIIIGSIPEGCNWLDVARPAVQQRMGLFAASETHFALMKIVRKPLSVLEEKLSIRMSLPESEMNELAMQELRLQIDEENDKLRRYKVENERRRYNYLPLAFSLFRNLAAAGKLAGLRDSAREKSQQRAANAKK